MNNGLSAGLIPYKKEETKSSNYPNHLNQQLIEKNDFDDWENIDTNFLLRELDEFKNVVGDMHKLILQQSETISHLAYNLETTNNNLRKLNAEIIALKKSKVDSNSSILKDYIVPVCTIANNLSPYLLMAGVKSFLWYL
jgi:uncharacterized coiled-coil DUF342 family protein